MKKNKSLALAMTSLALTGMLGACEPENANITCVYGPPPVSEINDMNKNSENAQDNGQNLKDPAYSLPEAEEFDPSENEPADVYGPPNIEEEPEEFRPDDNDAIAIYGPPGIEAE